LVVVGAGGGAVDLGDEGGAGVQGDVAGRAQLAGAIARTDRAADGVDRADGALAAQGGTPLDGHGPRAQIPVNQDDPRLEVGRTGVGCAAVATERQGAAPNLD